MTPLEKAMSHNIEKLQKEQARTADVLGTLILWMAQSANSPIRQDEAKVLHDKLHTKV